MRELRLLGLAGLFALAFALHLAPAWGQTNNTNNTNNSNNTNNNNTAGGSLSNAPAGIIISTEG